MTLTFNGDRMNADVFFSIGSTHHVCQDYALANNKAPNTFVVLSDGCSSAPQTDIGSRLIAKAAEQEIARCQESLHESVAKGFLGNVLTSASNFCKAIGLEDESILATLLILRAEKSQFESLCVGDGAVVGFGKEGLLIHEYSYAGNAPYYLAYEADDNQVGSYFAQYGRYSKTSTSVKPDGTVKSIKVQAEVGKEHPYHSPYFLDKWPYDAFDMVAVLSDGVQSFVELTKSPTAGIETHSVPAVEVIRELMAFKNVVGNFVIRRCQKAFKTFKEKNWHNMDDLSVGAIVK